MCDLEIPRRRLGKTDAEVSIMGLGGYHIAVDTLTKDESVRLIRTAIDAGINFMDNSWGYHDGDSEVRMGMALADGYRDRVFLMTKVDAYDKGGALKQLDESLARLKTDHLDLWQIHAVNTDNRDEISGPGGAVEALDVAKQAGKIRFAGFTGHRDPSAHIQMLDVYPFDAVQMPLNVLDTHFRSFEKQVVPELLNRDMGVIGMKSLSDGEVIKSGRVTHREAFSYALSLPVSVVVKGMQSLDELESSLEIVRGFKPLSDEEMQLIRDKTAEPAVSGGARYELYKRGK